jgi:hypothetical protein
MEFNFFDAEETVHVVVWVDQTDQYTTLWYRFLNLGPNSNEPHFLRFGFGIKGPEDTAEIRYLFLEFIDPLYER